MHAREGASGTRVLTRDVPVSNIRVRSIACTRSAKRGLNCTYCVCVQHHTRFLLKFKSSCTVGRTNEHNNADGSSHVPLPVQPPSSTEATFVIGQIRAY